MARVYDLDYRLTAEYPAPPQITGYEYQVIACFEAMKQGLLESPYMPHRETLRIMRIMDELRREWGVTFPMINSRFDRKKIKYISHKT